MLRNAGREAEAFYERFDIYERLGFLPTFTCVPSLVGNVVLSGQCASLVGTGVQLMANSLFGARVNRESAPAVLAAAIVGRTPALGLVRPENRLAKVIVRLKVPAGCCSVSELGAIGYCVGWEAGSRNIVVENVNGGLSMEQLKALLVPMCASGSVGICHICGITPGVRSAREALGGEEPEAVIEIGKSEIEKALASYAGSGGEQIDLVTVGCPHLTINEIADVAAMVRGAKAKTRLWLGAGEMTLGLARKAGFTRVVESAGGVFARTCIASVPQGKFPTGTTTIATNSFKAAHFISRLTGIRTICGSLDTCVDAAITGKWSGNSWKP